MFESKVALTRIALSLLIAATAPAAFGSPDQGDGQAKTSPGYASEVPPGEGCDDANGLNLTTDKTAIPVAQEIGFILSSEYRRDGGYDRVLKTIAKIDYYGTRYVDCEHYPLEVHAAAGRISVLVNTGDASKLKYAKSGEDVATQGTPQGLNDAQEKALMQTFDFNTPIADLEKDKNAFKPLGVQKLPGVLAWKLETNRTGDYRKIVYLDTHYGDVVRETIVDAQGTPVLDILKHDYRLVDGIRVPYAIDYKAPDGTVLANDRILRVDVTRTKS